MIHILFYAIIDDIIIQLFRLLVNIVEFECVFFSKSILAFHFAGLSTLNASIFVITTKTN